MTLIKFILWSEIFYGPGNYMEDTVEAKRESKKLVSKLRQKGISDEDVLKAIDTVPRHLFMDPAFLTHVYVDKDFPITSGHTLQQPSTVAFHTSLLKVKRRDVIIEISPGSGSQESVIADQGAMV